MEPAYLGTTFDNEYKIVLFGLGGVGKSAITIQYIRNEFVQEYDPTIEDSYRKQIVLDNEEAELDILDTAGQEEYSAMRDQYIRNGHGFMIIYAVNSRSSFAEASRLIQQILMVKDKPFVPIILIANKSDLRDNRQVESLEGQELAKTWNTIFLETSAKLGHNIDMAFEELVLAIRRYRYSKGMAPRTPPLSANNPATGYRNSKERQLFPPGRNLQESNLPPPLPSSPSKNNRQEEEEVDLLGCCMIL